MVKVLIFDLWDTVAKKDFSIYHVAMKHFGLKEYPGFFQDLQDTLELKPIDTNEDLAKQFLNKVQLPCNNENMSAFIEIVNNANNSVHLINGMEELLKKLKMKYKLMLLSTSFTDEFKFFFSSGLDKIFDDYVVSYKVGVRKPSKEIYEIALKKAGVDVSECVFIDNTLEHVEAARKLGMKGIHFVGVEELRLELDKLY